MDRANKIVIYTLLSCLTISCLIWFGSLHRLFSFTLVFSLILLANAIKWHWALIPVTALSFCLSLDHKRLILENIKHPFSNPPEKLATVDRYFQDSNTSLSDWIEISRFTNEVITLSDDPGPGYFLPGFRVISGPSYVTKPGRFYHVNTRSQKNGVFELDTDKARLIWNKGSIKLYEAEL